MIVSPANAPSQKRSDNLPGRRKSHASSVRTASVDGLGLLMEGDGESGEDIMGNMGDAGRSPSLEVSRSVVDTHEHESAEVPLTAVVATTLAGNIADGQGEVGTISCSPRVLGSEGCRNWRPQASSTQGENTPAG